MSAIDIFSLWQTEFNGFKSFYSELKRDLEQTISNFKKQRHFIETTYNESLTSLDKRSRNRHIELQNLLERDIRNREEMYNVDLQKLKSQIPTQNNSDQVTYATKHVAEKELEKQYNEKMATLYDDLEAKQKQGAANDEDNEIGQLYSKQKQIVVQWYKEAMGNLSKTTEDEKARLNKEFESKVKIANDSINNLHIQFKSELSQINANIIALSNENSIATTQKRKEFQNTYNQELGKLNFDLEANFVKIKGEFDSRKSRLLAIEHLLEKEYDAVSNVQKKQNVVLGIASVCDSFLFPKEMSRGSISFEIEAKIFLKLYPNKNESKSNIVVLYSENEKTKALDILSNLSGKFLTSFDPNNVQFIVGAKDAADLPKELYHLKIKTALSHPTPDEFPKEFDIVKKEIDVILTQLHASDKKSILQFNEESEEAKLRHNLLLLYDVGLKEYTSKWETIKYLVQNAAKADSICLFGFNTDNIPEDIKEKKIKEDFQKNIADRSIVIDCSQPDLGLSINQQYKFSETSTFCPVALKVNLEAVVKQLNAKIEELAIKNYLPITDYLFFNENNWKLNSSLKEINFRVGNYINTKKSANIILSGSLGDNEFPHLKIEAPAGAGKSNFINVMITSIAINYSPEQVQFYFIDKSGTAFGKYKDKLPHLKLAALNVGIEEANQLIEELIKEYSYRINEFVKSNIEEYKELGDNSSMARIIVVIDEFNTLWNEGHEKFQNNLKFAITQFRKAGIHIVCIGHNLPKFKEFESLQFISFLDGPQTKKIFENNLGFRGGRFVIGDTTKIDKSEVQDCFAASWHITEDTVYSGVDSILNTIPYNIEKYKAIILDYNKPLIIKDFTINEKIVIGKMANNEPIDFDLLKRQQKNNLVITGGENEQREDMLFNIFYQLSKHPNKKIQIHLFYYDKELAAIPASSNFSIIIHKAEVEIVNKIKLIKEKKLNETFDEHVFVIFDFENRYDDFIYSFSNEKNSQKFKEGESEFTDLLRTSSASNQRFIIVSNRMDNIESAYSNQTYPSYRNLAHIYSLYFIIFKSDQQEVNKISGNNTAKLKLDDPSRIIFYNRNNGNSTYLRPFKFKKDE